MIADASLPGAPQEPVLTLFSLPKSFTGHAGLIQENALASWRALGHDVDVVLFGDEAGIGNAARRHGFIHRPDIARNELGTPLLGPVFREAQQIARGPLVMYVNADIILSRDLIDAARRLQDRPAFLACGQRIDVEVEHRLLFEAGAEDWIEKVKSDGTWHEPAGSDYFLFPKGTVDLPAFTVGRPGWDNWLIFASRRAGVPVVDATGAITAIHQNHDYSHSAFGARRLVMGPEYLTNVRLAGGYSNMLDLRAAAHVLTPQGVAPAPFWRRLRAGLLAAAPVRKVIAAKRLAQHQIRSRLSGRARRAR